jgi:hypothetical protein
MLDAGVLGAFAAQASSAFAVALNFTVERAFLFPVAGEVFFVSALA